MAERPSFLLCMRACIKERERGTESADKIVKMVTEAVDQAVKLQLPGENSPFFEHVVLVVWANEVEYPGECDCGVGYEAFQGLRRLEPVGVHVVKQPDGDDFVTAPEHALYLAGGSLRSDWVWFQSPEASSYVTPFLAQQFVETAERGARQIGVALTELGERAWQGFTANTLGAWHVSSLIEIDGFDVISMRPKPDQVAPCVAYWDMTRKCVVYATCQGVEEVVPQARLFLKHGPCLAVLPPDSAVEGVYEAGHDEARRLANRIKFASKQARQEWMLARRGYHWSLIPAAVMPEYRRS